MVWEVVSILFQQSMEWILWPLIPLGHSKFFDFRWKEFFGFFQLGNMCKLFTYTGSGPVMHHFQFLEPQLRKIIESENIYSQKYSSHIIYTCHGCNNINNLNQQ